MRKYDLAANKLDPDGERVYAPHTLAEIKELEPPAAENAVLFLWAVNCLLPQALEVIRAWGFTYKSNVVWVKPSIGLGVWTRNRHELLLFATRGQIDVPEPKQRPDSVIEAKRGRHSEKPDAAYQLIEGAYPRLTKLELFARGTPRPGWHAWGNEARTAITPPRPQEEGGKEGVVQELSDWIFPAKRACID